MVKLTVLALALLVPTVADAGQMLVPGPGGARYSRPFYQPRGFGWGVYPPSRGYVQPGYLNGYQQPPYQYQRRGVPLGAILGGVLAGAAAAVIPQMIAPPMPMARPVAEPMPEPEGDAMDALPDASPNTARITRGEIEAALADWCGSNPAAPLCQKLAR